MERADTKDSNPLNRLKASAGLFYGLLSPFYLIRGNVKEYSITETWEFLNSTQTGKDLEALAKQHGICFILPDGTKIGDPEGEIINIYFDDTGDYAGYQQDNKIVIDDTLDWTDKGVDSVGAILAHEMQHAIDREAGLLQDYSGFESITDQEQLEEFLEQQTETRIASEVRAYERTENIILGTEYQDDGITSPSEIRRIIVDKDYETIYENQLNQLLYPNYTVDVYLNESTGELEVNLYPFINENFGNYA